MSSPRRSIASGRWYSVSTESDGKQQSGANKADVHIITADEVVALLDGTIVSKATITRLERDLGNVFGRITLEMNTGSNRGKTWVAIYHVSGTTLRWCGHWLGESNTLPTRFATTAGGPDFLRTMERWSDGARDALSSSSSRRAAGGSRWCGRPRPRRFTPQTAFRSSRDSFLGYAQGWR
ncbi:MAG: hypothetical protein H0W08_27155 [Acidobacteria bacterium]|nr:hypothetical protein [Acidobacteriota bacterium]